MPERSPVRARGGFSLRDSALRCPSARNDSGGEAESSNETYCTGAGSVEPDVEVSQSDQRLYSTKFLSALEPAPAGEGSCCVPLPQSLARYPAASPLPLQGWRGGGG